MPILEPTPENLDRAAALLRRGGVVAFPTETVYGLGADAFDAIAVARIFEIKARPAFDPLIVHVSDAAMLERVASEISPLATRLMARFWPGPLTLVMRKRPQVPDLVTAGLPTVAVRIPSHPIARALVERTGQPIAAPSANPFGYLSPTRAEHVGRMLGNAVDAILDGGATGHGIESTIVLLEPEPTLLRHGAIPVEDIETITGRLARVLPVESAPLAPGLLPQHYAPHTPIRIVDLESVEPRERERAGALAFAASVGGYAQLRVLSSSGDVREAAAHLFGYLHELDTAGLRRIDAQPLPEVGLGAAIMDRLRRAATAP
ncbi:MAG: L-threonylcarbamoyladenylate synthase [Vulcanimicrobiaceae bacterium]